MSRDSLMIRIDRLAVELPGLQRESPDPAEFWPRFAGQADCIVDAAAPDDYDWVVTQIDAMLASRGLAPVH
jgi:hypothetical protein